VFADSSQFTPFWERLPGSPDEPAATGSITHVQGLPDSVKAREGLALHKYGQRRLSPIALGFATQFLLQADLELLTARCDD
jgi:hypothetical protein